MNIQSFPQVNAQFEQSQSCVLFSTIFKIGAKNIFTFCLFDENTTDKWNKKKEWKSELRFHRNRNTFLARCSSLWIFLKTKKIKEMRKTIK